MKFMQSTYLFIARCKQKSEYADVGVKSLQTCKQGQKMFAKVVQISPSTGEDSVSINYLVCRDPQALVV